MLIREQASLACLIQNATKERFRHFTVQESIAILRKDRRGPHGVIHLQTNKPAEQDIVIELRDELLECLPDQDPDELMSMVWSQLAEITWTDSTH